MTHHHVYLLAMLATCAYAAVRGGAPERIIAAVVMVAAPGSWLIATIMASSYRTVAVGVAAIDASVLAAFLAIALVSTRFWPMLLTSLHAASLLGHVVRPFDPGIVPQAYYAIVAFWAYPQLAVLTVGTAMHRRRRTIYGVDYAWSADLPERYIRGGEAVRSGVHGTSNHSGGHRA